MFVLKKLFQLRDHTNPSAEKPFLEHLEDLRVCITRVVLTLVISTVVCFIFRNELMEIIRRPVTQVWERGEKESLEDTGLNVEDWELAKSAAEVAAPLSAEERTVYYETISDNEAELLENIQAVHYFRAALTIEDEEQRVEFIKALPDLEDALRKKALALLEGLPNAKIDARGKMVLMQALKPTEGFMLSIKLAFFAGIVISFPFLLFFLLQFVVPGLHDTERKALWPAMLVGFGLFLGGVFFAYFVVLPRVLEFFHTYSSDMMIENEWRIGYYISFATQFTLIFGISFELPVLVMTLVRLGILNSEMMRQTRAYAILAIFVIAAIITPTPDAFTLVLLAGPMVVLYEICIWLALLLEKRTAKREAEEEKERMARLLARRDRTEARDDDDGSDDDDHDDDPHGGGHDPDDPDHGDGSDPDFKPGAGHGHPNEEDDHHGEHDHSPDDYHDPYHDEHGHGHGHEEHEEEEDYLHDDVPGEEEYEPDLGFGDDGHTGDPEADAKISASPEPKSDKSDSELQQDFEFHEEKDPAEKDSGNDEDEDEKDDEKDDEEEDEYLDGLPEDIPEEERNRDRGDPDKRDQD